MRHLVASGSILFLVVSFVSAAPTKASMQLSDEGLPLQEMRPLDRRVYVLTLYGKWDQAPGTGTHFVNFLFPNGGNYSHKVDDEALFRKGEVHCIIQGSQIIRNGISNGGKFTIAISANEPVSSATAPEVISNALEETWPMHRHVSLFRTRTKYSEPPPVDIYPIPGEFEGLPQPAPKKVEKP
jgi:hypothetical protein